MRQVLYFVTFVILFMPNAFAVDATWALNWKRQQVGLPVFVRDPVLVQAAERKSRAQARRGRGCYHVTGGPSPGNLEGVGYSSWSDPTGAGVHGCSMNTTKYRYAGAAACVGSNGRTYYTIIYGPGSGRIVGVQKAQRQWCFKCKQYH